MDEDRREKENRSPGDSSGNEKKEWSQAFFAGFRAMLQSQGYPVEGDRARASPSTTTLCDKIEVSPECLGEKHEWKPSFNSYEEFIQKTLKSLDGFMIILNTDGIIMFVASRVFLLLGHISEEIVGKTLLSLLPDSEKRRVYQKIALKIPVSSSVGKHITFGCHLRRGNVEYDCSPIYEYVKIILNVIDISEEPLALFTQLFSRRTMANPLHLPVEDRFYLVGLVCVIKSQLLQELCTTREGEETEEDSDDEGTLDYSFRRITYHGSTYRTESLCAEPETFPIDNQATTVSVEQYGSRHSSSEFNIESESSADSRSSSPEVSPSWNALTCFQSFSFNLDRKGQMVQRSNTVPSYKYCVVEMEDNPSLEKLPPLEEVEESKEAEEKPVEEEPIQKEGQQVKEEESVAKADEAAPVLEVKSAEEAAEVEAANEAGEADSGEESKLTMKTEPEEESTGRVDPAKEVEPAKEGKVEPVEVETAVKVAKETLKAADFAEEAEVAEGVEEKLENLKEAELPQQSEAELEPLPYFSLAASVSAQSFVPVTASMATTTLAVTDTTELLHADTKHSQETLEEITEQAETTLESETQLSTSVPCESPGAQTSEALIKHTGKLKRSYSDVIRAKRFRASPLSPAVTSEELGEPHDTSTQAQLPKAGAQDPPSPSAAQDPAEVPADGAELKYSGDEQHVRRKP